MDDDGNKKLSKDELRSVHLKLMKFIVVIAFISVSGKASETTELTSTLGN